VKFADVIFASSCNSRPRNSARQRATSTT
jgi:hypothetical protein